MNTSKTKNKLYDSIEEYIERNYYSEEVEKMKARRYDSFYGLSGMSLLNTVSEEVEETEEILDYSPSYNAGGRKLEDVVRNPEESFSNMVLRLIDEKGLSDVEVYKKAGIDRRVFSRLRSRKDYQPSRNTGILLAMAMKLSLDEATDLLGKAGFALSHSSRSDLIVRYFLETGNHDIMLLDEALVHFGERALTE